MYLHKFNMFWFLLFMCEPCVGVRSLQTLCSDAGYRTEMLRGTIYPQYTVSPQLCCLFCLFVCLVLCLPNIFCTSFISGEGLEVLLMCLLQMLSTQPDSH